MCDWKFDSKTAFIKPTALFQGLLLAFLVSFSSVSFAQLSATNSNNGTELAQALVGPGVAVSNVTLNCATDGAGFFTASAQSLGIGQGVVLTTGYASDPWGQQDISSPNGLSSITRDAFMPGDPQLENLAGGDDTYDACVLQFDVIPQGDTLKFDYIFGSEEYNEFVNAGFNDVFAFFISGPGITGQQNIAKIPGTNLPVSIDNVNCGSYSQYYQCNDPYNPWEGGCNTSVCPDFTDPWDPEYDGLTKVLTAKAIVQPCQTYHLKLAITDVGDGAFDSGVFLKQGSLTSAPIDASPNTTVCPGQTYQMNVTGVSPGGTIVWSPAAGLSCSTCSNPVASPSVTTTYTVTVSYGPGCSATDHVVVTVSNGVQADISATASSCSAPTGSVGISLISGSSPFQFVWSNGATTQNISNVGGGTYTVSITDGTGCSATFTTTVDVTNGPTTTGTVTNSTCEQANGSVNITASGGIAPYNYSWSNGAATEDVGSLSAGDYTVTVSDAQNCTATQSFTITTTTVPNIFDSTLNAICTAANGSIDVTITEGTPPYAFTWSNGATTEDLLAVTAGTYSLTVADGNACSASSAITVQADAPPPLVLNGVKDSVCVGSSFGVKASGYSNYNWLPSEELNLISEDSALVTVNSNQTYSVIGTDNNGCVDTVSFDVTSVPYATVDYTSTFHGCEPLHVELVATPTGATSVQWWVDGNLLSTNFTFSKRFYDGIHNGMLVAVSPIGCNDTVYMPGFIDVLSTPNADFQHALDAASGSLFIFNFTNLTTDATNYFWNFGDNTFDSVTNPVHTFPGYGKYPVLLTASNQNGCVDTALHVVEVTVPHNVFIPNTITPNGDGMNETLKVYGLGIRSYRLQVFDRLGELVFEGVNNERGWDGTFKGKPLNMGTFVYIADVEFLDDTRERFWGDVNILR